MLDCTERAIGRNVNPTWIFENDSITGVTPLLLAVIGRYRYGRFCGNEKKRVELDSIFSTVIKWTVQ